MYADVTPSAVENSVRDAAYVSKLIAETTEPQKAVYTIETAFPPDNTCNRTEYILQHVRTALPRNVIVGISTTGGDSYRIYLTDTLSHITVDACDVVVQTIQSQTTRDGVSYKQIV